MALDGGPAGAEIFLAGTPFAVAVWIMGGDVIVECFFIARGGVGGWRIGFDCLEDGADKTRTSDFKACFGSSVKPS